MMGLLTAAELGTMMTVLSSVRREVLKRLILEILPSSPASSTVAEAVLEGETDGDAAGADDGDDGSGVDAHRGERGDDDHDDEHGINERHDEVDHRLVAFGALQDFTQHNLEQLDEDEPHDKDDETVKDVPAGVFEKIDYLGYEIVHKPLLSRLIIPQTARKSTLARG